MTKNKLEKLGFKKIPGTEPGFHMYELTPAKLQAFDENFKPQARSSKREEWTHKGDTWVHPDGRKLTRADKRTSSQARKRTSKLDK